MTNRIAIASDHAGVELKTLLLRPLRERGLDPLDLGTEDGASVDYPDYALRLCNAVLSGEVARGVLICGSGIGMSIAANRHRGIRAALCVSAEMAALSRRHNDANVLVLGARLVDNETAAACLAAFLDTAFEGGRHQARLEKMG